MQFSLFFLIAACQDQAGSQIDSSSDNSVGYSSSTCTVKENLIENPEFILAMDQAIPHSWKISQHSGEISYQTNINSGVLTITKIATQPWFTFAQKLDAKEWSGKKMLYSADLKLNLTADGLSHAFEPGGGLYLVIYGDTDPLGGDNLIFNANLQHEPKLGNSDWTRVAVEFIVPKEPTRLLVGFMHQANGSMSVSNPYLSFCKE